MTRHTATTTPSTSTTAASSPVPVTGRRPFSSAPEASPPRSSPAPTSSASSPWSPTSSPRFHASPVEDPSGSLSFLLDHQAELAGWYFVLYLLGGAAMALVSLGVGERLSSVPALARVSTALGLIWSGMLVASGSIALVGQHAAVELHAQNPDLALSTWVSTSVVQDALGGGIEVAGALWAAVVGFAALRSQSALGRARRARARSRGRRYGHGRPGRRRGRDVDLRARTHRLVHLARTRAAAPLRAQPTHQRPRQVRHPCVADLPRAPASS